MPDTAGRCITIAFRFLVRYSFFSVMIRNLTPIESLSQTLVIFNAELSYCPHTPEVALLFMPPTETNIYCIATYHRYKRTVKKGILITNTFHLKNNNSMNKQLLTLICLLLGLVTLTAQGYIKFDGIDGEATEPMHKGWSDLTYFSVDMSNATSAASTGGGRATGKVNFGDLIISKNLDKSSPKLMEALATGKNIPKVELHVVNKMREGKSATYYRYELKNVTITSYQISGDAYESNVPPNEQISMSYAGISVFYVETDQNGKPKGEIPFKWDIKGNKAGN